MTPRSSLWTVPTVALLLACGATQPSTTHVSGAERATTFDRGRAFALVMSATSCWMGGLWADALGEKYDARTEGIDERCNEVVRALDASPDFQRPLRAVDATAVQRISHEVRALAAKDPADAAHANDLVPLLFEIADAMRESTHARLAADQVKEDAAKSPAPETYRADKNAAAEPLSESKAMRALVEERGPYASDARAVGVLVALDRMEIAHKLPKHLKVLVAGPAYAAVFGVTPPAVGGAPADRSPPGIWLGYLTDVAAAGGYPVPQDVVALPDRESYAWSAVLAGFADKLRATPAYAAPETKLGQVVRQVVARLDDEWETAKSLAAAKRAHR
jgi:hypothetical protein